MDSYNVKRRAYSTWYVTRNGALLDLSGYLGRPYASSRRTAEFYVGYFTRSDDYQAEYGLLLTRRPRITLSPNPQPPATRWNSWHRPSRQFLATRSGS